MSSYICVGEVIRYYRKKLSISQDDLATGICTREYIGKIERNQAIPTLNIINLLSQRLGVNLYEAYTEMFVHHDVETHTQVIEINDAIGKNDCDLILSLIEKNENAPSFQDGEPLQFILYAKCFYAAKAKRQFKEAIEHAHAALLVHFSSFEEILNHKNLLSKVELAILLNLAVDYFHINKREEGINIVNFLKEYTINRLPKSFYAFNRGNHFEINYYFNIVYIQYLYHLLPDEELISNIDEALQYVTEYHYSSLLVQLLFCKSVLLKKLGNLDAAGHYWSCANNLGVIFYGQKELDSIKALFE